MAQDIQVFGKRNEKDKLKNINLTRSVRLNDLTQEELAKLYRRGKTNATTGSLNNGFKFDYLFESNAYNVALDVVAITFHSSPDAVVFDCGYSAFYDRFFEVLLSETTDGSYSLSQWISKVPWLTSDELKTVNGQSLVGTGDIEIAAGVESLNGQTGNISLKTVNGNELIGTGDIEIKGGGDATPTGTTLYFTTTDGQTLNANIQAKNKAGTVIEPSLKTPTAWYYDEIVETMGFPSKTTNCNLYSLNGVNIPLKLIQNKYLGGDAIGANIMENCVYADLRKFLNTYSIAFMFNSAKNLKWLDISNFNTYIVDNFRQLFGYCGALTSLNLSNFNTSKAKDIGGMFSGCRSLTSLDLSNFKTSQVTNMDYTFSDCSGLTSLDLSNWDTSKVTLMNDMFSKCRNIADIDLSNWDMSKVTNKGRMFYLCTSLKTITMKNCSTETIDKIKSALQSEGILDKVTIITN